MLLAGLTVSLLPTHSAQAATAASAKAKAKATSVRKAKPAPRSPRKVAARAAVREIVPAKPSFGQMYGLHDTEDPLDLKSSVALVLDQDTNEVLFSKNPQAVLPIASITKLMTALLVVEANQSLDEKITISDEDKDTEKFTGSRLAVGTTLTRGELLHLALMSSENRAAHALGRNYPGGLEAFVGAMNLKAHALGMVDTHYVEPTGLSSRNQSSAKDLAMLVKTAHQFPLIRELSTSTEYTVALGRRLVRFGTTNGLVKKADWDIGLQKTGFINEAGQCLVMQAQMAGRKLIMVFLDSAGKYSRIGDAERVRKWLMSNSSPIVPPAATATATAAAATATAATVLIK
ncbi:D-alanyl-D-alanine endopeptidase [Roseateles amylovorans]|uniref:D-alanyl-D-alanine endopeptidase n=1 Tax=Roseateles amylovorans TaxID=2978473 RepID=A0ABY6B6B3_9BURK|nr:D-alanyl-D-alanine endopeptidase [Roseateles amylovorans]UXH80958.1 D-alanyl-D-alanine endopeptidase [Roseateles amylovorans]